MKSLSLVFIAWFFTFVAGTDAHEVNDDRFAQMEKKFIAFENRIWTLENTVKYQNDVISRQQLRIVAMESTIQSQTKSFIENSNRIYKPEVNEAMPNATRDTRNEFERHWEMKNIDQMTPEDKTNSGNLMQGDKEFTEKDSGSNSGNPNVKNYPSRILSRGKFACKVVSFRHI